MVRTCSNTITGNHPPARLQKVDDDDGENFIMEAEKFKIMICWSLVGIKTANSQNSRMGPQVPWNESY